MGLVTYILRVCKSKVQLNGVLSFHEGCFILANSADPGEMPPYATFHPGLHCLPYYMCTGIYNENN